MSTTMNKPRIRSWKERWDPDAEFVFNKRMKLGLAELDVAMPGDPVPKDLLGLRRLRIWWEARVIRLAGDGPPLRGSAFPSVTKVDEKTWDVHLPGQEKVRVSSEAEAEALMPEPKELEPAEAQSEDPPRKMSQRKRKKD